MNVACRVHKSDNALYALTLSKCELSVSVIQVLRLTALKSEAVINTAHEDDMTSPVHRKSYRTVRLQLQKVAERWRLHRPVRSTVPSYDVTCQLT